MNVKKTTFMSFFSTFVQIVLKTNKNVSILWCVSKLWTKEKLWKRREVYHESKKRNYICINFNTNYCYSGGYQSAYKEYNLPKTPYSKVVKLPEKWRAVAVDSAEVGATQFVTLKRGTGKWKVSLQCNPVLAAY